MKILALNLGSTSTKLAYSESGVILKRHTISHPAEDLAQFESIWEQHDYRKTEIISFLEAEGIDPSGLDAVVSRGGHTVPLEGGVYRITEEMLRQSASEKYGCHATDLGIKLAKAIAGNHAAALTVDPPTTDEFEALARYSGLPEIQRKSAFHVLNQRACAKYYAEQAGVDYSSLNLVVAHLGGGISVCAHRKGRLVDANNALTGDGPFSTNRSGGLPVGALVELCYSGQYTKEEMFHKLNGGGGMVAYIGESDVRRAEERANAGDTACAQVLDAMAYQTAKEIGACAAVLAGNVDAIILTGGMANSARITNDIRSMVEFIAPVVLVPGEREMEALCRSAFDALNGAMEIKELKGGEDHAAEL